MAERRARSRREERGRGPLAHPGEDLPGERLLRALEVAHHADHAREARARIRLAERKTRDHRRHAIPERALLLGAAHADRAEGAEVHLPELVRRDAALEQEAAQRAGGG